MRSSAHVSSRRSASVNSGLRGCSCGTTKPVPQSEIFLKGWPHKGQGGWSLTRTVGGPPIGEAMYSGTFYAMRQHIDGSPTVWWSKTYVTGRCGEGHRQRYLGVMKRSGNVRGGVATRRKAQVRPSSQMRASCIESHRSESRHRRYNSNSSRGIQDGSSQESFLLLSLFFSPSISPFFFPFCIASA